MPDEHSRHPPEQLTIKSDLSKALDALPGCQISLIDSIQHWLLQQPSISSLMLDQIHTSAFQAIADQHPRWVDRFQLAHDDLMNRISERFSEPVIPQVRDVFKLVDRIGRLGWTMTLKMTVADLSRLAEMKQESAADSYMLDWYEECDADLAAAERHLLATKKLAPFHTALSQCFAAFHRGDYAVTVPCLAAVLEGGIKRLGPGEHFFSTDIKKTAESLYMEAKEDDPDALMVSVPLSLWSFVRWFYEHYDITKTGESRMFRHGIQHGTQPPANERVEVIRLFHALQTLAAVSRE